MEPESRREEPVRHRRQQFRHRWISEPDCDDYGSLYAGIRLHHQADEGKGAVTMRPAWLPVATLLVLTPSGAPAAAPPAQPIPFSHKVHAGTLKLACGTCHPNPDPGELM